MGVQDENLLPESHVDIERSVGDQSELTAGHPEGWLVVIFLSYQRD